MMNILRVLFLWISCICLLYASVIFEGKPYSGVVHPHETQSIELSGTKGLKRIFYYQCTGTARLTIIDPDSKALEPVAAFHDYISKNSSCDAESLYACVVDPCQATTCDSYPSARCESNYCGGCNAIYWEENKVVNCEESKGSNTRTHRSYGAPPHMSVVKLNEDNPRLTFLLKGELTSIDTVNSYQLYVFDNKQSGNTHIPLTDSVEVYVTVTDNTTITLSWTEPAMESTSAVIKEYCIYHKEEDLWTQLNGNWVACGHELKSSNPATCVQEREVIFKGLSANKTHYFWVVVKTEDDVPTAYPFVKVDLEMIEKDSNSRTQLLILSQILYFMPILTFFIF